MYNYVHVHVIIELLHVHVIIELFHGIFLGFAEDQFNQDDPSLGNKVRFYNDLVSIECAVETYYTTTDQIICRTG